MISVLLLILKILGVMVGLILSLVLFVIFLLCVSPVRYHVAGSFYTEPDGKATISWLLHVLHVCVGYEKGELFYKIRIFGIPVMKSGGKKNIANTEKASEEKQKRDEAGKNAESKRDKSTETDHLRTESLKTDSLASEMISEKKNDREHAGADVKADAETVSKLEKIQKKYKDIRRKLKFIRNEKTEAAVKYAVKKVLCILKSVMPKKLSGQIRFGMENPADTGSVLGVLAVLMPIHKNHLEIEPDFTEAVFEGAAAFKGRIYIGFIAFSVMQVMLNKNVRITVKRYKKHFSAE